MPPKASRAAAGHEDPDAKPTQSKDKNGHGHGHGHGHTNGKMKRVASAAGSNLKDVTSAASIPAPAAEAPNNAPAANPSVSLPRVCKLAALCSFTRHLNCWLIGTFRLQIQWATLDRDFLHRYRREHHLNVPTAYASDYRSWVLTRPGSIGTYSPTVTRKKEQRRQARGQLTNTVRKHFNSQSIAENDAIVDFLHRVRKGRLSKLSDLPKMGKKLTDQERI